MNPDLMPKIPKTITNEKCGFMDKLTNQLLGVLTIAAIFSRTVGTIKSRIPMIKRQLDQTSYGRIRDRAFHGVARDISFTVFCDEFENEDDQKTIEYARRIVKIMLVETRNRDEVVSIIQDSIEDAERYDAEKIYDMLVEADFPSLPLLFNKEQLEKELSLSQSETERLRNQLDLVVTREKGLTARLEAAEAAEAHAYKIGDRRTDHVVGLEKLIEMVQDALPKAEASILVGGAKQLREQFLADIS